MRSALLSIGLLIKGESHRAPTSAGTYCTVDIHIPRKLPSLLVPAAAVVFNQGCLQVAVIENGIARLHRIVVARDLGTEVEVRDGVAAGDRVTLNPAVDLSDGDRVDPSPAEARPR